jgi:TRAP-type C4-dicarboxylate transport system permease small subunit
VRKERDILNDHEIRIQKLEDRIRRVFFINIILCIVVSVLLVAFIATTVAPEVVRWYNGLSDYNRGAIGGIVAVLMLTIFVITLSRLESMW